MPAALAAARRTVPLQRAPQAAAALLQVAADRGISRARINLRPADLGGVEVQLSSTPAGVTARLVADSPDAARMLAQAGDELRRALESRDVTLLSLEVATSNQDNR
jgi:flagellar hook-length control protein FliK